MAVIEIVSAGNKSSKARFRKFVKKTCDFLDQGVHVLIIDLFPPTPRDPQGIHQAIWSEKYDGDFEFRADKTLTLASYRATTEGSVVARSSSRSPSGTCFRRCRCSSGPIAISTLNLNKLIGAHGTTIPRRSNRKSRKGRRSDSRFQSATVESVLDADRRRSGQ